MACYECFFPTLTTGPECSVQDSTQQGLPAYRAWLSTRRQSRGVGASCPCLPPPQLCQHATRVTAWTLSWGVPEDFWCLAPAHACGCLTPASPLQIQHHALGKPPSSPQTQLQFQSIKPVVPPQLKYCLPKTAYFN